ncbi:MAG: bifunctional nicotinamidase/pyrazinamidase [Proteobacteria bacterium]|nr:bifunctional nicotinamidase/pyrazinamidase [Pseudomonadota bacterium]
MRIDPTGDILGLVDVQPTFMPDGELAVADGDAIVPVVNCLMGRFPRAFATQDWHPADHVSFASQHPGKAPYETITLPYGPQVLWPDHGIAGTPNAALHPDIDQRRVEVVIRKGCDRQIDSYSAFQENDRRTPTGLDGWLRQRGFTRLFLCGLATDFCVGWSAEDAVRLGYAVVVIEDACRGIGLPVRAGWTTMDDTRQRLLARGVAFITSDKLG